jgi:hypothetical protein
VRRAIVEGGDARKEFVGSVKRRLCVEGRGDIFSKEIERDIGALLPSLFEVLAVALRAQGKSGEDVALYEHDFEDNRLQEKIVYELMSAPDHGLLL